MPTKIVLWRCLRNKQPDFELSEAQQDIIKTWGSGNNSGIFSADQVARRSNISKRAARRAINRLEKAGIVQYDSGGYRQGVVDD